MKRNNSNTPFVANYKNIPGLMLGKQFTAPDEQVFYEKQISDLFELFRNSSKDSTPTAAAIPQVYLTTQKAKI